ncbi:hypothetical protein NESM_000227000 [Novymonas esmeraldas]|uniref:Uncharacterized protein n=1 Tax=Novymonas esmeraldas TaxID=1808958 RepID=A0AAW0F5R7_9TRYP
MPGSSTRAAPAGTSQPLDVEDADAVGVGVGVAVSSPVASRPSSAAAAAAAAQRTPGDVEAVERDPAALWAALDLPAPESLPSQHTSRRVVLLGRPLSGKRSLCRRLCFAAEAQYAGGDDTSDMTAHDRAGEGAAAADNDRQSLYHPSSDDDTDAALFPPQHSGAVAGMTAESPPPRTTVGPHDRASPLCHGSGLCFDYVVQRVPTRIARGGGGDGGDGGASTARRASTGFLSSPIGGTVRRTTEFFCCDNAGALTMALPTLEHVESAVVLMVVDASDVSGIQPQLDYCYATLDAYVANLLRTQAPSHDEVRRMQLAAAQQDYWYAEEQKLRATRTSLASGGSAAATATTSATAASPTPGSRDTFGDAVFKDPAASLDKVNSTPFRVPASAGTVCTMHSIVVCNKVEHLDRASRALATMESGTYESEALLDRLGIPADMRLALRHSRQSLLSLVAQLVRQYAVYHRAALASVCHRVSMTTAGADGEYAYSGLVNPFYKGLWAYVAYVLYSSKDPNTPLPADVLRVCSARMHPHALLPAGLDALGLLSPFITSSNAQLPEGAALTSTEDPISSEIHTTAEDVTTPDGVFPLHQQYIQQAQAYISTSAPLWIRPEETPQGGDGMVWDSI